jgi:outer membrane autotransporter protein
MFHSSSQNGHTQAVPAWDDLMSNAIRAALMLAACMLASNSRAQVQQPGNLYEFGDSFQDAQYWCTSFATPLRACSNYRDTPMRLGAISNYAFSLQNDYAVGSSASGPGTFVNTGYPPYPGSPGSYPNMFGQIAEFQAEGRSIGANDLVTLSYAGNDVSVYGNPSTALARATIGYLTTDVRALIGLGGRNFVLFGGVPFDRLLAGGPNLLQQQGVSLAADREYYTTLNAELPAAIRPFESASLHLRILDANALYMRVLDTPSIYGFVFGDCAVVAGCASAPLAVQNQYAFYRGHPSDAFALVIARYIDNLLTMPYQIAAEADLAQAVALAFHDTLAWRLDAEHLHFAGSGQNGTIVPAVGRLAVFVSGDYAYADRSDRSNASGGNGNAGGLTAGAEYWATPNLLLGAAFSYSSVGSTLNNGSGKINLNAYQFAGFASLGFPHWFVDGVLSGGVTGYTVKRPGVIDTLSGSPQGSNIVGGVRGGYLFDVQHLQIGPIAGLTYVHVGVGSYIESGDMVLAQSVGSQKLDGLTGSAGVQLRYPGLVYGHPIRSFVDLTAERDFLGDSRIITTTGLDAVSAVPVYTPVSSATGTYGRVAAGVEADLVQGVALGLMGGTTFARSSGNQGLVQVTLRAAF